MTGTTAPADGLARRLTRPVVAAVAGSAALVGVVVRDPHVAGSWGVCPFLYVTGLYCPACGGLRAANELAHGRLGDALGSNALGVAVMVYSAVVWTAWTVAVVRGRRLDAEAWFSKPLMGALVVAAVVFAVARNLPMGAWLAP